ncbi:hypothetical protein VTI74DRAFT_466 [Chaetomium olivicolor]
MSIARAFTTRRVKQSLHAAERQEHGPHRSNSTSLKGSVGSIRHKISSPVELIHTTNMLSYNAPDIQPLSASSTNSSPRSDDDMSDSAHTTATTPPTSPDVESPKRSRSPEPNHLSCFFTAPANQQTPAPTTQQSQAPTIPQRTLPQPKKTHNVLIRQRSASGLSDHSHRTISSKASFSFSRSSSTSTSTSVSSTPLHRSKLSSTTSTPVSAPYPPASPPRPAPPHQHRHQLSHHQHQHQHSLQHKPSRSFQQAQHPHRKEYPESLHPFGPELAQVSELAEEYGVREQLVQVAAPSTADDAEEQLMAARGLVKISADEYVSEIRGLFALFMGPPRPVAAEWI